MGCHGGAAVETGEWLEPDHGVAAFDSRGSVTPLTAGDTFLVGLKGGCVLEALLDLPHQGIARPGDVERTASQFGAGEGKVQLKVLPNRFRLVLGVTNKLPAQAHLAAE